MTTHVSLDDDPRVLAYNDLESQKEPLMNAVTEAYFTTPFVKKHEAMAKMAEHYDKTRAIAAQFSMAELLFIWRTYRRMRSAMADSYISEAKIRCSRIIRILERQLEPLFAKGDWEHMAAYDIDAMLENLSEYIAIAGHHPHLRPDISLPCIQQRLRLFSETLHSYLDECKAKALLVMMTTTSHNSKGEESSWLRHMDPSLLREITASTLPSPSSNQWLITHLS
jgi:hypothetical protein